MKRQRLSERDTKDDMDRLSDLPDCVLLHIMEFMNIEHAVQTCVLSTRWKHLWKRLTNLTLCNYSFYSGFRGVDLFDKFVSRILSCRDGSIPLHNLHLERYGCIKPTLLNGVMRYAASHNVQQLTINVQLNFKHDFELPPCIFSCRSLTYLELSIQPFLKPRSIWFDIIESVKLPKSLELPALKSLHLKYLSFSTSDKGCAEPFSTCNMLNTLVITCCYLQYDAKVLCISNSKLSSLTIDRTFGEEAYKIALSTPNLSSLTIMGRPIAQLSACNLSLLSTPNLTSLTIMGDPIHQLSACNLSLLKEVNIDADAVFHTRYSELCLAIISWLQVLAKYVKIMTLSSSTLKILKDLSNPGSMRTQPPCFVRLTSLKVKMDSYTKISDEEVSRIVEYLLQNSPLARVDIINC